MKNLMNLGKALNKNEQKKINGGEMLSDKPCGPLILTYCPWLLMMCWTCSNEVGE